MPDGDGVSSATGSEALTMAPNQIAALVPSFDPAKDDLQVYSQKVPLLLEAWPAGKYTELVTRLILNCTGSAFLKLQLHQKELLVNDRASIKKLVELLGGHWGRIGLEKKYEHAERALYRCIYVTLRGSTLSSEDEKKVLVDADVAGSGDLSVQRVSSAIRMLGAGFFQDMTGLKSGKLKTYDQATLLADTADDDEIHDDVYAAEGEIPGEDDMLDVLMSEGDTDAIFVTDFENAVSEVVQNDEELAAAFNSYTDARKRLNETFRHRGFWPVSSGGESQGHAKGRAKGKFQKGRQNECACEVNREPIAEEPLLFETHSSLGVVDLGATKTVIGSNLVADLINNLRPEVRKKLSRCPCQITFRFGNHGTLQSQQALVAPLQDMLLKIAIVPGSTPFLISNTLIRAFQAVIDVERHVMWSKKYQCEYPLQLTSKGLFLIDLNDLAANTAKPAAMTPAETHLADSSPPKQATEQLQGVQGKGSLECEEQELPDVSQFSMDQLDKLKVQFGTKHLGRSVWSTDQQWVAWFVKHYHASTKGTHRLLLKYIKLKVERVELEGETIPVTEAQPQVTKGPASKEAIPERAAESQGSPMVPPRDGRFSVGARSDQPSLHAHRANGHASPAGESHAADGGSHSSDHAPSGDDVSSAKSTECSRRNRAVDAEVAEMIGLMAAGEICHDCPQHDHPTVHTCKERQRLMHL
eukprot:s2925_g2.t1